MAICEDDISNCPGMLLTHQVSDSFFKLIISNNDKNLIF